MLLVTTRVRSAIASYQIFYLYTFQDLLLHRLVDLFIGYCLRVSRVRRR